MTRDTRYEKTISSMQEFKSCNGKIIAIDDEVIYTPATLDFLQPIPAVVALQLLALTNVKLLSILETVSYTFRISFSKRHKGPLTSHSSNKRR